MRLSLCPQWNYPKLVLELRGTKNINTNIISTRQLSVLRNNDEQIYSDIPYSAMIDLEGEVPPEKINIYLNGEQIRYSFQFENGIYLIDFKTDQYPRSDIFRDCYGYVQFELECIVGNTCDSKSYFTDYIVVMLKATEENKAIQRMAEYVYQQHQHFLWKNNILPFGEVQLKRHEEKSLDTYIAILSSISQVYEFNIPYFRTNPHTKAETVFRVDDFSKLQSITPQTLTYIAQHPEELQSCDIKTGIRYQKNNYYPMHTLMASKQRIRNVYENQIVLGFIHEVVIQTKSLIEKINSFIHLPTDTTRSVDGYISSSTYILQTTLHSLSNKKEKLLLLNDILTELYWEYKKLLPISDFPVTELPMPTAVFLSNESYRQMYDVMSKWFLYGVYDFSSEEFLLPLLINNRLYEYYVLFKIANAIEKNGFIIDEKSCHRHLYSVDYENYKDTEHINTFVFKKSENSIITLYFQPVVWGQNYSNENNNGISLRRSSSLSLDRSISNNRGVRNVNNAFYTPDYIIKYSNGESERYVIADAKLSSYKNVRNHQIENLVYKYFFSIHPTNEEDQLIGIWILYGKDVSRTPELCSVYDIFHSSTMPDFWLTSLTEAPNNQNTEQNAVITQLLHLLESI